MLRTMATPTSYHAFFLLVTILRVTSEELADCPVKCTCSDSTLNCAQLALSTMPQNVTNAGSFKVLNLCTNNLTSIRVQDLITFTNLDTIDLSKNSINLIEEGTFVQLPRLRYLDLSDNMLTSLPDYSFKDLSNLTSLDLENNRLVRLGKALNKMPGLLTLNLAKNLLAEIPLDVFEGTSSVTETDLSSNKLPDFPTAALEKLPALRTVMLSVNKITKLGECALGHLEALETLQLESNLISSISDSVFLSNCSQNLNSSDSDSRPISPDKLALKTLDLTDNLLTVIPHTALSFLTKLDTLNLNSNLFTSIKPGTFTGIHSLLFVSVSFSPKLRSVENGSFVHLHALSTVYLHHCPVLTNISSAVFVNTPNLNTLQLHDNSFSSVSQELLKWGENITMTLVGNPFQCDCRLKWISDFYDNVSTTNRSRLNLKGVRCTYPHDVRGLEITSLHPDQFHCSPRFKSIHSRLNTAVIAAVVCGVLGLLVLLLVKFRNRICIFVKRQFRYKAHRDNRELFSVKLSEIMIENDPEPFYDDSTKLDLRPIRGHDER